MSVEALNEALGVDVGPMDRVSITVADPDIIRSWSKGEVVKILKPLIIVLSSQNQVAYFAKRFLVQFEITNVHAESIKGLSTKEWSVTDVE